MFLTRRSSCEAQGNGRRGGNTSPGGLFAVAPVATAGYSGSAADWSQCECVWKYDTETHEGMIIVSGDYGAGLLTKKTRDRLGEEPTDADLAEAYRTAVAFASKHATLFSGNHGCR